MVSSKLLNIDEAWNVEIKGNNIIFSEEAFLSTRSADKKRPFP
jgi:hypothetical protein